MSCPDHTPAKHWIRDEYVDSRTEAFASLDRQCLNSEAILAGDDLYCVICLICSPIVRPWISPQLLDWARAHLDAFDQLTDHQRDQLAIALQLVPNVCNPADVPVPPAFQDPQ